MKPSLINSLLTIVFIFVFSNSFSQISLGSAISKGSQLGGQVSTNLRDKKKQKNIEAGLREQEMGGKKLALLRVPSDKIVSTKKLEITWIQDQLDKCLYDNRRTGKIKIRTLL